VQLVLLLAAHSGFYENALYKFTFTYLLTYLLVFRVMSFCANTRTDCSIASSVMRCWHQSKSLLAAAETLATDIMDINTG